MPQGGFADRRLLNQWGPHQNEVFMGNASAPRRKSGVLIFPDMRRENLFNLRGPRKIGNFVGHERRLCRPEAIKSKGVPTGVPVGNTLSNLYLPRHARGKYTLTREAHRNAAAKPGPQAGAYLSKKPAPMVRASDSYP